ncbi:tyrosine-type recombinase/integrase [Psychroserpens burtonensis]|uniref:tyrosine-type recombinase/integrase n=1 Tax=Psychroserpens burtonensis TaxID=49278 RepID=UPI000417F667|nr:tyrosine-type recombinase/integrase [Psychroserpens burtonensis]
MTQTFYLKQPKNEKETLILFSCYFKRENFKFVYSTGEKINPTHWSFEENRPKLKGRSKDVNSSAIKGQLDRYSLLFENLQSRSKKLDEFLTSEILKSEFNIKFKKSSTKKNLFFEAYAKFMDEKEKHKLWKPNTVKKYINLRNHLLEFEKKRNFKLTFGLINEKFYSEFVDFCYEDQGHFTNTLSRNIGFFKSFMLWSLKNKYTYNDVFKEFIKPTRVLTREEALSEEQLTIIFEHNCKSKSLEKVRDIFIFQCFTGLRFGEMKTINKRTIENNYIVLKEEKDSAKETRQIPLFKLSKFILEKYDYELPLISNQKHNEIIKVVLKNAGMIHDVEYTRIKGVEQTVFIKPFYERITTHTARRTFISILRNKGIADKTVMSITGHKDLKTFNMYHKVDDKARKEAVEAAFSDMELPKLKKA